MTTPSVAAHRRNHRRWAVTLALVLTIGIAPSALAASSRTVVGELRGVTRITWSGNAGIRLRVPRDVMLPATSYRLTVRKARYISVRTFLNPQPIGCRQDQGLEWCAANFIDWFADFAETGGHEPSARVPEEDHFSVVSDPPIVLKGGWDLYLFTDGVAQLELRVPGLSGTASYNAGGKIRGQVMLAAGTCGIPSCLTTPPLYADQRKGGATFDVGRLGFVQAAAYGVIATHEWAQGIGANQPFVARSCMYPNGNAPLASTDPKAHPDGCDIAPGSPDALGDSVLGIPRDVSPASGRFYYTNDAGSFDGRGKVYLGFRAGSVGPDRARLGGYGLWFRYGIS